MARPTKQGVEYFPLDVYLDDKFKFIEIKFKLEGFAILIKLFQKIYSYGYWCQWTEDEMIIFADENRTELDFVKKVIDEAVKREIFDSDLYEKYNILTSKGIQKRYKEIVRRRKDVEVIEEYLLIDNTFGVNDDTMTTSSKHNDNKSTQSKVKESKVKESKDIIMTSYEAEYISVLENIKGYPLDREKDLIYMKDLVKRYPDLDLVEAIKKFSVYILDNPFKKNANHRSQINTSFSKYVEWGTCIKKPEIKAEEVAKKPPLRMVFRDVLG